MKRLIHAEHAVDPTEYSESSPKRKQLVGCSFSPAERNHRHHDAELGSEVGFGQHAAEAYGPRSVRLKSNCDPLLPDARSAYV